MDPIGHLSPWLFSGLIRDESIHIRPTIAITKAHMKVPEIEQSVRQGRLSVDGKICLNESGELAVTKFAVEPVWYLPGVADRFGIGTFILAASDNLDLDIKFRGTSLANHEQMKARCEDLSSRTQEVLILN